jgi:membrane-associated phospholipid phosphatase
MRDLLIHRPRFFYLVFLPFLVGGMVTIYFTHKPDLFLFFNQFHWVGADFFFTWVTWLGNGLIFMLICLVILFKNRGQGILGIACFAVSALVPQLLKRQFFADALRPAKYFDHQTPIYLVEGVKQHFYHSFPSGHSASVFALALFLTLITKNKKWGLVFGFIAIITAYSRVYLAQHFFEDIYAGACIGFISTILVFILLESRLIKSNRLNQPLFGKRFY